MLPLSKAAASRHTPESAVSMMVHGLPQCCLVRRAEAPLRGVPPQFKMPLRSSKTIRRNRKRSTLRDKDSQGYLECWSLLPLSKAAASRRTPKSAVSMGEVCTCTTARVGRNNQRALRRMCYVYPVQCATPFGCAQDRLIAPSLPAGRVTFPISRFRLQNARGEK